MDKLQVLWDEKQAGHQNHDNEIHAILEELYEDGQMDAPAEICEIFTCPICRDVMLSAIHMCDLGHSFCESCYYNIDKCAMCRNNIGALRNYNLEQIRSNFIFQCNNKDEGCTYKGLPPDLRRHEKQCSYATS
ncbi:hypothetical protein RN001_008334 [Aquatica leii]|uniref:RING-type domain-containing protein n=1 Tax=Aquatica leii TaxID=1421715 RepID=A0AAN7QIY3_9COLE|nr:hypothetical protein RN001_008334 [Aquatica leii]